MYIRTKRIAIRNKKCSVCLAFRNLKKIENVFYIKRIAFTIIVQNILHLEIIKTCIVYIIVLQWCTYYSSMSTVYIIVQDVWRLEINVLYTLVQNVLHLEEKNVCIQ